MGALLSKNDPETELIHIKANINRIKRRRSLQKKRIRWFPCMALLGYSMFTFSRDDFNTFWVLLVLFPLVYFIALRVIITYHEIKAFKEQCVLNELRRRRKDLLEKIKSVRGLLEAYNSENELESAVSSCDI